MSSSNTTTAHCLSDLEIANLIAGQLQGEARERALRHLAECEDCYEVFAEAQAFLAEEEVDDPPEDSLEPTPGEAPDSPTRRLLFFPSRGAVPAWVLRTVAAGVLVGVGLAWLLPALLRPPTLDVASWSRLGDLPPLASKVQSLTPLPTRDVTRGIGEAASQTAADFRFGAEWAHLEAALHASANDDARATASRLQERVHRRIEREELTANLGRDLELLLQEVASPSSSLVSPSLRPLTRRLSDEMAVLGYEFDLGRFAEAGRLAAEAGDAEWFRPDGEAARYLREMQALAEERRAAPSVELATEARQGLEAIARAWPVAAGTGDERFREVAQAFEKLILAYDAQALNRA